MPTTIYYFTGTGNSLAIARQIAAELGETELVPIPKALAGGGPIRAPRGAVGFAFPVYCAGLPRIVARFAEAIDLANAGYIFCACTMGGSGATGAFAELEKILRRQRKKLDAGCAFVMPSNFVDNHDVPGEEEQREILAAAKEKARDAAAAIREKRLTRDTRGGRDSLFLRIAHPFFIRFVPGWDKKFSAGESCIGCTTCEKVCPVGNITIVDQRPVWHDRCEMCYACVNFCKKRAIQTGEMTKERGRYTHPDVTVKDMMDQHGRKPGLSSLRR